VPPDHRDFSLFMVKSFAILKKFAPAGAKLQSEALPEGACRFLLRPKPLRYQKCVYLEAVICIKV
jgi:hypothetical protein